MLFRELIDFPIAKSFFKNIYKLIFLKSKEGFQGAKNSVKNKSGRAKKLEFDTPPPDCLGLKGETG